MPRLRLAIILLHVFLGSPVLALFRHGGVLMERLLRGQQRTCTASLGQMPCLRRRLCLQRVGYPRLVPSAERAP
jgi:hypothetical protein